jgi:hypothetical protein
MIRQKINHLAKGRGSRGKLDQTSGNTQPKKRGFSRTIKKNKLKEKTDKQTSSESHTDTSVRTRSEMLFGLLNSRGKKNKKSEFRKILDTEFLNRTENFTDQRRKPAHTPKHILDFLAIVDTKEVDDDLI